MKLSLKPACPDCGEKHLWLKYLLQRSCPSCKSKLYITKMSMLSCFLLFVIFLGILAFIINKCAYYSTESIIYIMLPFIIAALAISPLAIRMISKKTGKELYTSNKPTLFKMHMTEIIMFAWIIFCVIFLLFMTSRALKLFIPKFILDPYPSFTKAIIWLTPATTDLFFTTIVIISLGYLLFGIILLIRTPKKKLFSSGIRFFETSYKLIAFLGIFAFAGLFIALIPFAFALSAKSGELLIHVCNITLWTFFITSPVIIWFFANRNKSKCSLSCLNKKLTQISIIIPVIMTLIFCGELIIIRKIVRLFFMEYGEPGPQILEFIAGKNIVYGILSFFIIMCLYFIFLIAGFRRRIKFSDRISFCLYMNKFLFLVFFSIICLLATTLTNYLTMFTLCMCGGDGIWNQETYPHLTWLSLGITITTAVLLVIFSKNIKNVKKCKWIYLTGILIFIVFYLPINKRIHPPSTKAGFINKQGELIIKPQFTNTGNFKLGLCNVFLPKYSFRTPAGFINKKGEWVITPQFASAYHFSEGFSIVTNSFTSMSRFINRQGKFLNDIEYRRAYPFSNGMARVEIGKWSDYKNSKSGYINTKGKLAILKSDDSESGDFHKGLAWIQVKANSKGEVKALTDSKKPTIDNEEPMFLTEDEIKNRFDHEMVTFIDKSGNFAIKNKANNPMLFLSVGNFSEGLTWVKINTNSSKSPPNVSMFTNSTRHSKVGFINKSGNFVVKPKYHYAKDFKEGMAPVKLRGAWGFVNTKGQLAVKLKYAEVYGFSGGLARVYSKSKYGFIDKSGKEIIPIIYENAGDFSEGLAAVQKDSLWGYIDKTGKFVIKPKFYKARDFSEGLAAVDVKVDY